MAHTRTSTSRRITLRSGKRIVSKKSKPTGKVCLLDIASTASNDSFEPTFKLYKQKVTRSGLVLKRSIALTGRSPKKVTFAAEPKKEIKKTLAPLVQQRRIQISESEVKGLGPIMSRRLGRRALALF